MSTKAEKEQEELLLEQRKVKALEKIANSMDALTVGLNHKIWII